MANNDFFLNFGSNAKTFADGLAGNLKPATESITSLTDALAKYDEKVGNRKSNGPLDSLFTRLDDVSQKFADLTGNLGSTFEKAIKGLGLLQEDIASLLRSVTAVNSASARGRGRPSLTTVDESDLEGAAKIKNVQNLRAQLTSANRQIERLGELNEGLAKRAQASGDNVVILNRALGGLTGAAREAYKAVDELAARQKSAAASGGGFGQPAGSSDVVSGGQVGAAQFDRFISALEKIQIHADTANITAARVSEQIGVAGQVAASSVEEAGRQIAQNAQASSTELLREVPGRKNPLPVLDNRLQETAQGGSFALGQRAVTFRSSDIIQGESFEQNIARTSGVKDRFDKVLQQLPTAEKVNPESGRLLERISKVFFQTGGTTADFVSRDRNNLGKSATLSEQVRASGNRFNPGAQSEGDIGQAIKAGLIGDKSELPRLIEQALAFTTARRSVTGETVPGILPAARSKQIEEFIASELRANPRQTFSGTGNPELLSALKRIDERVLAAGGNQPAEFPGQPLGSNASANASPLNVTGRQGGNAPEGGVPTFLEGIDPQQLFLGALARRSAADEGREAATSVQALRQAQREAQQRSRIFRDGGLEQDTSITRARLSTDYALGTRIGSARENLAGAQKVLENVISDNAQPGIGLSKEEKQKRTGIAAASVQSAKEKLQALEEELAAQQKANKESAAASKETRARYDAITENSRKARSELQALIKDKPFLSNIPEKADDADVARLLGLKKTTTSVPVDEEKKASLERSLAISRQLLESAKTDPEGFKQRAVTDLDTLRNAERARALAEQQQKLADIDARLAAATAELLPGIQRQKELRNAALDARENLNREQGLTQAQINEGIKTRNAERKVSGNFSSSDLPEERAAIQARLNNEAPQGRLQQALREKAAGVPIVERPVSGFPEAVFATQNALGKPVFNKEIEQVIKRLESEIETLNKAISELGIKTVGPQINDAQRSEALAKLQQERANTIQPLLEKFGVKNAGDVAKLPTREIETVLLKAAAKFDEAATKEQRAADAKQRAEDKENGIAPDRKKRSRQIAPTAEQAAVEREEERARQEQNSLRRDAGLPELRKLTDKQTLRQQRLLPFAVDRESILPGSSGSETLGGLDLQRIISRQTRRANNPGLSDVERGDAEETIRVATQALKEFTRAANAAARAEQKILNAAQASRSQDTAATPEAAQNRLLPTELQQNRIREIQQARLAAGKPFIPALQQGLVTPDEVRAEQSRAESQVRLRQRREDQRRAFQDSLDIRNLSVKDPETGQRARQLQAFSGDQLVGALQFEATRKQLNVQGLETRPEFQRRGVATALQEELLRVAGSRSINRGDRTPQGAAFFDRFTQGRNIPQNQNIVEGSVPQEEFESLFNDPEGVALQEEKQRRRRARSARATIPSAATAAITSPEVDALAERQATLEAQREDALSRKRSNVQGIRDLGGRSKENLASLSSEDRQSLDTFVAESKKAAAEFTALNKELNSLTGETIRVRRKLEKEADAATAPATATGGGGSQPPRPPRTTTGGSEFPDPGDLPPPRNQLEEVARRRFATFSPETRAQVEAARRAAGITSQTKALSPDQTNQLLDAAQAFRDDPAAKGLPRESLRRAFGSGGLGLPRTGGLNGTNQSLLNIFRDGGLLSGPERDPQNRSGASSAGARSTERLAQLDAILATESAKVREALLAQFVAEERLFKLQESGVASAERLAAAQRQVSTSSRGVESASQKEANQPPGGVIGLLQRGGKQALNFASFQIAFTGIEKVRELVDTAVQAQSAFVRLQSNLEATGRSASGLVSQLSDISSKTGQPLAHTIEAASELTGVLKSTADLKAGTLVATELANISQGALTAKEAAIGLRDVIDAYGLTGVDSIKKVGDQIARISQVTGVSVKDVIEGTTQLAQEANSFGITQRQAAVLAASVTKNTGETGEGAAEQVSRIFSTLNNGKVQSQLERTINPRTGKPIATAEDFAKEGGKGQVLGQLLQQFDQLEPQQRSAIENLVGSGRQARALSGLLRDAAGLTNLYNDSQKDVGTLAQQNARFLQTLGGSLEKLSTDFRNFGVALEQAHIFDIIGVIIKGLDLLFSTADKVIGGVAGLFNSNPISKGLLQLVVVLGEAALAFKIFGAAAGSALGQKLGGGLLQRGVASVAGAFASPAARAEEEAALAGGTTSRGGFRGAFTGAASGSPIAGLFRGLRNVDQNVGRGLSGFFAPTATQLLTNDAIYAESAAAAEAGAEDPLASPSQRRAAAAKASGGGFISRRLEAKGLGSIEEGTGAAGKVAAASEGAASGLSKVGGGLTKFAGGLLGSLGPLLAITLAIEAFTSVLGENKALADGTKSLVDNLTGSDAKKNAEGPKTEAQKQQDAADALKQKATTGSGVFKTLADGFTGGSAGNTSDAFDKGSFDLQTRSFKTLREAIASKDPKKILAAQNQIDADIAAQTKGLVASAGDKNAQTVAAAELTNLKGLLDDKAQQREQTFSGISDIDNLSLQQLENLGGFVGKLSGLNTRTLQADPRAIRDAFSDTGIDPGSKTGIALDKASTERDTLARTKDIISADKSSLPQLDIKIAAKKIGDPDRDRLIKARDQILSNLQSEFNTLEAISVGNPTALSALLEKQGDYAGAASAIEKANAGLIQILATTDTNDPKFYTSLSTYFDNQIKLAQLADKGAINALNIQSSQTLDPAAKADFAKQVADKNLADAKAGQAKARSDLTAKSKTDAAAAQKILDGIDKQIATAITPSATSDGLHHDGIIDAGVQSTVDDLEAQRAAAQTALDAAKAEAAQAGGKTDSQAVIDAQIAVNQADLAKKQAFQDQKNSVVNLSAAIAANTGDQVTATARALQVANNNLAFAVKNYGKDSAQANNARIAIIQAVAANNTALDDALNASLDLEISLLQNRGNDADKRKILADKVQEAQNNIDAFRKKGGDANSPEGKRLAAAANDARRNQVDQGVQIQIDTLAFQRETFQITSSEELRSLQEILKNKQITQDRARSITGQIKGLQAQIRQELTGGGFNIPSAIKLPTAFEVRRSLGAGFSPTGGTQVNQVNNNNRVTINNNVPNAAVAQKVAAAVINMINSQTGQSARANTSTPRLVGA